MSGYATQQIAEAWHDSTCPMGPHCRSRLLHAVSDPLVTSGVLGGFLDRLCATEPLLGRSGPAAGHLQALASSSTPYAAQILDEPLFGADE